MTVAARRVTSIPVRLATTTWDRIVDLVAPTNAAARSELTAVTGVAASLITREAMAESPIIVAGDGPRLRIYCLYGEQAIEGTRSNEAALSDSPAETGSWCMSLPCPSDDLTWVKSSLARVSSRITARDLAETDLPDQDKATSNADRGAAIDMESFLRP